MASAAIHRLVFRREGVGKEQASVNTGTIE